MNKSVWVLVAVWLMGCATGQPEPELMADDFSDLAGLDEKSDAFSSRIKLLGLLDYEVDSPTVRASWSPKYLAYAIRAEAGDEIEAWVRSGDGDALSWLLDETLTVIAANDNAGGGTDSRIVRVTQHKTYFLVFREKHSRRASFHCHVHRKPPPCAPTTCAEASATCGTISDGCGGTLACGSCASPDTCGGGGAPGQCGRPACVPTTCVQAGQACGSIPDGCGGALACGGCAGLDTCGGGGVANTCGCTPNTGTLAEAQAIFDARLTADPSLGHAVGSATQLGHVFVQVVAGGWSVLGGAQDHAWLVANFHDRRAYLVHDGFLGFYEGWQGSTPMYPQFGTPLEDEHADGVANHVAFQQFERGHMIWYQSPWSGQTFTDAYHPVCPPETYHLSDNGGDIVLDDDLVVQVNGVEVYRDWGNGANRVQLDFQAYPGDAVTMQFYDIGWCRAHGAVWLSGPSLPLAKMASSYNGTGCSYPNLGGTLFDTVRFVVP